jgi:hypothetical protein
VEGVVVMEERKKLIDALRIIKDECGKHEICDYSCPLLNGCGRCAITEVDDNPCDWVLNDPEESIWRAII